jgi:TPP-dependent 2-oxoacid decarboxylase
VNGKTYSGVELGDLLAALGKRLPKRVWPAIAASSLGPVAGGGHDPIGVDALYPRWANFLEPHDILVAETGTASMGLGFARMPKQATFHNQTLWGSIGWATPAAFGAAVAAPDKRIVLITGDGAHQRRAQRIADHHRGHDRRTIALGRELDVERPAQRQHAADRYAVEKTKCEKLFVTAGKRNRHCQNAEPQPWQG